MPTSVTRGGKTIFRVASPMKYLTPVIGVLAFTLVLIFAVSKPSDRVVIPYMVVIFAVIIAIVWWIMSLTRLEVSSDEIVYYSVGYRVRSTWPNIQGYGKRVMGAHDVDTLILRQSGLEMSRWLRIGLILQPVGQVAALAQGRVLDTVNMEDYSVWIPVGVYADDWRSSELGDLIKRYAPEAFDTVV